jgi:hypothetical protein
VVDPGVPSDCPEPAEANNATLKKLIVEAARLIHASQDVLAHPERRRAEELSPDIVALIASCGERTRKTDQLRTSDDPGNRG